MVKHMMAYWKKLVAASLALVMALGPGSLSYAQALADLPPPGTLVVFSVPFVPAMLKGIKVHQDDPLQFDFILDRGERPGTVEQLKAESLRLVKYFLASLTVPEKDLWVNLSPYEKDRIIPESFGMTEMGRDLLAQDYILKQVMSSAIFPEGAVGRKFWQKVYALAQEKFGTTDIPIDTFNKVWIVPDEAEIYENRSAGAACITASHLKVMLEKDYLAHGSAAGSVEKLSPGQEIASDILREVVVPVLEQEVNEGENFFRLKQVYQSLILAVWYKKKITQSLLTAVYVDQNKTAGVNIADPQEAEKIWSRYLESFKKGVYELVREEYELVSQELIPRKYFSGGFDSAQLNRELTFTADPDRLPDFDNASVITVDLLRADAGLQDAFAVNGIDFSLVWANSRGKVFAGDLDSLSRNDVKEHFQQIFSDPWRLSKVVENIYRMELTPSAVRRVNVAYVESGAEKHVFHVRIEGDFKEQTVELALALKSIRDVAEVDMVDKIFRFISRYGWMGLTPRIGGQFGRFYYEEWVNGETIDQTAARREITPAEIEQITETWMRLGKETGYPIDINPGNIMFREVDTKDFVIVDGFGYDVLAHPAMMVRELLKYYSFGHEQGFRAVMRGIHNVLGDEGTWFFMVEALVNRTDFKMPQSDIDRISVYLSEIYDLQAPVEAYLLAAVTKNLQRDGVRQVDAENIVQYTGNNALVDIRKRMLLNRILAYDPSEGNWEDHKARNRITGVLADGVHTQLLAPATPRYVGEADTLMAAKDPSAVVEPNKGGIDLGQDRMALITKGGGDEIEFTIDPAMLAAMNDARGFAPIIVSTRPLADLQLFMGL